MPPSKVKPGDKFDKVTILNKTNEKDNSGKVLWSCICDCGKEVLIASYKFKSCKHLSCGCSSYKSRGISDNRKNKRLYGIWRDMKQRCTNPKCYNYKAYGGRGISYTEEWESYDNFYNWAMDSGYTDDLTIDRIDVNDNYSPDNCKWSTREEQDRNRQNTIRVTINNENMLLMDAAKTFGFPYQTLLYRHHKGIRGNDLIKPVKK